MLVAICGMFASCYEKEEIDVPTPSTTPAKYYVKGIVTDATTGAAMTAFTVNGQSFTSANGEYSLQLEATGVQTITIKADNYITLSKSIDVKALPNGETGTYVVDAALEPVAIDIPDPEYMTNQYNINGTLYDIDGNKVKFAAGDKVTIEGQTVKYNVGESTFTVENVTPGNYIAFVNVAGYTKTYAQIVITEAPLKEGTGVNTIVTRANVVLQKIAEEPEPEPAAKYYIEGNIWGANNVIVDGATVEINLTNGQSFTPSINNGYYKQEIPAEYVGPTVLATVKVSKSTYYPFACSFLMVPVSAGQTSVSTVNITLIPINKDTTEDGSIGGNTNLNPVENGKTEVKDKNVIAQEEAAPVVKEDGTEVKVTVNDVLDAMEEATGETVTADKITTVTTTTELNKDLVSDIVNADGTVQQIKDIVSLPTSAVVIYTQNEGEGSTVAQNINVSRDLATEKAEAAVRTYEGTPKGVVFATPLNITFGSEIATTEKADYLLPVLYYNEISKTWVEDKVQGVVNYAMPQDNGQFKAEIRHFSKFKFGFTSKIDKSKEEAPLAEEFKPYPCFTGNYDQIITVKGQYKGGSRYIGNTPQLEADAKLTGVKETTKKHIVELLQKMIKADNMNILPQPNYKDVAFSQDMSISPNQQIEGFTITRSEKEITYSITVIKADRTPVTLTVTVASVVSYKIAPKQTPSHGHGHGDNLNAGGGIVDLD
ncbi:DUF3869 domain-containing protein [Bacteroides sp. 41_26]|uniref:DUF3869 domain-containing protein n=2 Tax=Bacteroides TaxID=816 RepID=UPI00259C7F9A|nr:DUF3869 domain-containing protein [Bacteroides sp. 41_26]